MIVCSWWQTNDYLAISMSPAFLALNTHAQLVAPAALLVIPIRRNVTLLPARGRG